MTSTASPSSSAHVSAYSCALNPPTETQTLAHRAALQPRQHVGEKTSRPGFASPIAFSMPASVSAIRGGAFPSRGSGVTVFVTNASSDVAMSGRGQRIEAAARVQEKHRTGPSTHKRFSSPSISTTQP